MNKTPNNQDGPWFHGSPEKIEKLLAGSRVTPYRELAQAFSHKPSCTSASDDFKEVKHDGTLPGYLYVVAGEVRDGDLTLLPGTDNTHWRTTRELPLTFVEKVPIIKGELLTGPDLKALRQKHPGTGYWSSPD